MHWEKQKKRRGGKSFEGKTEGKETLKKRKEKKDKHSWVGDFYTLIAKNVQTKQCKGCGVI